MNKTNILEQQFTELLSYIENKRSEASQAVNEKQLCTAWVVGGYVSAKLKSEEWGSKDAQIVQTAAGQLTTGNELVQPVAGQIAISRSMSPTMIAEYKRMLIPKEKMQMLLKEYCDFIASATT